MNEAANPLLMKRLNKVYSAALKKALADQRQFLRKVQGVYTGKIKPPVYYVMTGTEDEWKKGFVRQALRQYDVIEAIMRELNMVGSRAARQIQLSMVHLYKDERNREVRILTKSAQEIGIKPHFAMLDTRAIELTLNDTTPVFSKIAYRNLGRNKRVRQRLQNEMAQAIALGENRKKVVNRISNVVNEAHYNAARTAQTESTRIRSQARFEAVQEAEEMGIVCERVWHCRYNHTRESHLAMEGQTVRGTDEPFISGLGNSLRYPGDPLAPAADVINCYCYVQDRVVSGSPTLARIRQDNAAKRAAWVAQMTDKNNPAANRWRDV